MLTSALYVGAGGAMGAIMRYLLGVAAAPLGNAFPWSTLIANVTGSFLIGFVAGLSGAVGKIALSPDMRLFLMVGLCGGYTTFSSFSQQTLNILQAGQTLRAGVNILSSVALCLVAVWAGTLLPAMLGIVEKR